jgi:hypothetical protein
MITRKDLLIKGAYGAGALMAVNGILPGLSYLERVFAEDNTSAVNISERDHFLLRHASLAPSGHNTQPWRVKIVSDSEWIIGWDKSRSLPAVDPKNRELLLSIGTFCEALNIAAKSIGLECVKKVTAKNAFSPELVKIRFTNTSASNEKMYALSKRRTIKNGFLSNELSREHINQITGEMKSKVYTFPKGSREAGLIDKAVLESNRIQAWRDDAQSELADWIRWRDKDSEKHRNGLTSAGMEINGLAALYVKNFFSRDDVLSESFRNQTVELTQKYLSSYGSWIILSTESENPETLIHTGGDFLKLGLNAYSRKIALHPMTQPLEEKGFEEALQKDLNIKGKMQFILRAGYVEKYPDPVTLRMPVERIVYN